MTKTKLLLFVLSASILSFELAGCSDSTTTTAPEPITPATAVNLAAAGEPSAAKPPRGQVNVDLGSSFSASGTVTGGVTGSGDSISGKAKGSLGMTLQISELGCTGDALLLLLGTSALSGTIDMEVSGAAVSFSGVPSVGFDYFTSVGTDKYRIRFFTTLNQQPSITDTPAGLEASGTGNVIITKNQKGAGNSFEASQQCNGRVFTLTLVNP